MSPRVAKRPTLLRQADALCGQIVRSRGFCQSRRENHAGVHQWAHGFSRRYKNTRWLESNGFCLCQGCHYWFTLRPLEWDEWLLGTWGADYYDDLRALALSTEAVDMSGTVDRLRARWASIQEAL